MFHNLQMEADLAPKSSVLKKVLEDGQSLRQGDCVSLSCTIVTALWCLTVLVTLQLNI